MKTYNDLFNAYKEYVINPINEEEYAQIMNTETPIVELINKVVEYGRFVNFSKKWIEENKEELAESAVNIEDLPKKEE